ncbi:AraC family transcriptional regulator [Butyrivibrio fibrisolvens]|uniref:AraC family transcriptional regulator n=1 Tax=Butyrivibrio fibrisolvens TaxID=831 RepID=UPI0004225A5C|nr:AraC family transcriptional regulator [Butyrivibrio fibrisolvens]
MSSENENNQTLMFHVGPPFDMAYHNNVTNYPVGPHSHNATELYFTLTDLPDVLLGDTIIAVPAGTLIIIPPFCVHQLYHEAGEQYERYILTIHDKWLDNVLCEGASAFSYIKEDSMPLLLFPDVEQKRGLIRHFDELLSFMDNRTSPDSMVAFFSLLSDIHSLKMKTKKPHSMKVSASQKKVNDIISYLSEHLSENLTISDLAAQFYLNPDYLARLFKRHMHVSLGHYIMLQRISAAQALLREGKTVREVQEYLGFSSYAYFFRTFQKVTGISPSNYRRISIQI